MLKPLHSQRYIDCKNIHVVIKREMQSNLKNKTAFCRLKQVCKDKTILSTPKLKQNFRPD